MSTANASIVFDMRSPDGPMLPVAVRLPSSEFDKLQELAKKINCYPSALARSIVCRGLAQLDKQVA